jgi:hypothetical protein
LHTLSVANTHELNIQRGAHKKALSLSLSSRALGVSRHGEEIKRGAEINCRASAHATPAERASKSLFFACKAFRCENNGQGESIMYVCAPSNWTHLIRIQHQTERASRSHAAAETFAPQRAAQHTKRLCHVSIDAVARGCALREMQITPCNERQIESNLGPAPPRNLIALLAEPKQRQFKFESTLCMLEHQSQAEFGSQGCVPFNLRLLLHTWGQLLRPLLTSQFANHCFWKPWVNTLRIQFWNV